MTIELSRVTQTETTKPASFNDKYTSIVERYPRLKQHFDVIMSYQQKRATNLTDEEMEALLVSRLWAENPMLALRLSSVLRLDRRTIHEYVDMAAYELQHHSDQLTEFEKSTHRQGKPPRSTRPAPSPANERTEVAPIESSAEPSSDILIPALATTLPTRKEGLAESLYSHPLLTAKQEQVTFEHLRNGSTPEAVFQDLQFQEEIKNEDLEKFRNIFSQSKNIVEVICYFNFKLVDSVARQWNGLPQDDKIQEGYLGLLQAIEKFDTSRELKFSTYAVWWIRQAITRAIHDKGREIRIPVHINEHLGRLQTIYANFQAAFGRSPNTIELRRYLTASGLPASAVNGLIEATNSGVLNVISIHQKVGPHEETELLHFIADQKEDHSASMSQSEEATRLQEKRAAIATALKSTLSKKEIKVILRRFGFAGQVFTLEEIGQDEDLTRERIRQIEATALQKLRGMQGLRERLWEQDTPSFVYSMSAQDAAFRLGLAEKGGKEKSYEWGQAVGYKAINDKWVWSRLSEKDRAILAYYLRLDKSLDIVLDRLGQVFSKSKKQISIYISDAVENAAALLVKKRMYDGIKRMISEGYSNKQIRECLNMPEEKADWLIHYFRTSGH